MLFSAIRIYAQTPGKITIEKAYELARNNYPLTKRRNLIALTSDYSVSNAAKGYLPSLSVNGQATYQSAVTTFPFSLPIKGFVLPAYSRDQYRITAELDQAIYDGGVIGNQQQAAKTNAAIQQRGLEVELYTIYGRVNELFFGVLLLDEQLKENDLLKQDIQNGIDKAKALVANGTAYRSSVDELRAQLLQAEQARIELIAIRKAYLTMLGLFIGMPLDENTMIEKPVEPALSDQVNRPELSYYEAEKKGYDVQEQFLNTQLRPKLGFFTQGGYGRPGLNPLSNDFQWYYIGGLKLSWSFNSLYTLKKQKKILEIGKESLDIDKETFLFNTALTQKQQLSDIAKYAELFKKDDAIIRLRESVKNASAAQLENGVLSAHDYINEVNAEDGAKQNLILHQVELLQEQYNYQNTMGNLNIQQ